VMLAAKLLHSGSDQDVRRAIERAHFCESLALALNEDPAELYMLGMLSMMDRMLNIPMAQLLNLVSLNSRIQEGLLGSAEGTGRALEHCRYYEHGGSGESPLHGGPLVRESASHYFDAVLSAGRTLHAIIP